MGDGVSGHLMAKDTIDTQVFSGLVTNQSSPPSLKLSYIYVFHDKPCLWLIYMELSLNLHKNYYWLWAWLVPRLLHDFRTCLLFCLFVCGSPLITRAITMAHTLLPCKFTMVNLTAALSIGVATMSSLCVPTLRSRGNVDATLWGWLRVEMPEASSYSWCLQSS